MPGWDTDSACRAAVDLGWFDTGSTDAVKPAMDRYPQAIGHLTRVEIVLLSNGK